MVASEEPLCTNGLSSYDLPLGTREPRLVKRSWSCLTETWTVDFTTGADGFSLRLVSKGGPNCLRGVMVVPRSVVHEPVDWVREIPSMQSRAARRQGLRRLAAMDRAR
jgi:hypothetical protein